VSGHTKPIVAPSELDAAIEAIDAVEGWLSDEQAAMLWRGARALPEPALVVEIGSYRARSTIVLASALGERGEVVAIDPHAGNDRGPRQWEGPAAAGQADHETFNANLERAGVRDRVRHVRIPSAAAGGEVEGEIDLLYIDGSHRYRAALSDIDSWGGRVHPGGELLIHDCFSSIGVTLALLVRLVPGGAFRYLGRAGSMARYRREPVEGTERVANAGRQLAQLGWFARNLVVKLAVVLRLRPLARLAGQRELHWPY